MPLPLPLSARCMVALLGLTSCACAAQATEEAPVSLSTPDHPYVLHVYTDLLQIPALVLKGNGKPDTQLTLKNFKLRLDSGPPFQPTALHVEGDEPLNLALVLDAGGAEDELLSALVKSPAHGIPQGLLPHDHLGLYGFDCRLLRVFPGPAAISAPAATDGIAHLLSSPSLHDPKNPEAHRKPHKTCGASKAVWDAVSAALVEVGAQPGRRALILVSDGDDSHSQTSVLDLLTYAISHSIAIFVLREPPPVPMGIGSRARVLPPAPDDPLPRLAVESGGMVIDVVASSISAQLDRIVALLRSRYILQFPRPSNGTGGSHRLDVAVSTRGEEVYAAGISVPVRDAALMNDPNTVPADTSKMPVQGKSKR